MVRTQMSGFWFWVHRMRYGEEHSSVPQFHNQSPHSLGYNYGASTSVNRVLGGCVQITNCTRTYLPYAIRDKHKDDRQAKFRPFFLLPFCPCGMNPTTGSLLRHFRLWRVGGGLESSFSWYLRVQRESFFARSGKNRSELPVAK